MRAGRLRDRATFQRDVGSTADAYGQPVPSWSDRFTVWGELQAESGGELRLAGQVQANDSHVFTTRRGALTAAVTSAWRCVIAGRVYQIDATLPPDNRREAIRFRLRLTGEPDIGSVIGAALLLGLEDNAAQLFESADTSDPAELLDAVQFWKNAYPGATRTASQAAFPTSRPTWQADGVASDGGDFMVLSSAVTLSADFTVYAVGKRAAGQWFIPLANPANNSRLDVRGDSETVEAANTAGNVVSAPYTGTPGAVLMRWRRDPANVVKFAATGMAEVTLGTLAGSVVVDEMLAGRGFGVFSNPACRFRAIYPAGRELNAGERETAEAAIQGKYQVAL